MKNAVSEPSPGGGEKIVLSGLGGTVTAFVLFGGAAIRMGKKLAKRRFRLLCDETFREVDADNSGTVDEGELYVAVLLVYLAVNRAVRVVCAVKPPPRDVVTRIFRSVCGERSDLTEAHFAEVMDRLVRDAGTRAAVAAGIALACPLLAGRAVAATAGVVPRPALGYCGDAALRAVEPHFATLLSVALVLVALPVGIDAVERLGAAAARKRDGGAPETPGKPPASPRRPPSILAKSPSKVRFEDTPSPSTDRPKPKRRSVSFLRKLSMSF